jgi:hypothetical protein
MVDVTQDSRERGLDFFVGCEAICRELRLHTKQSKGETAMDTMQAIILRDVEFLHNLPLQTLNDRLKRHPFVDPTPFDELLTEMMAAILEWFQWVTEPDWIVEVLHAIGAFLTKHNATRVPTDGVDLNAAPTGASPKASDGEELESRREDLDALEELAKFVYPMPLKLRDLQSMVRPFMEVRSHHYISGLDAVVAELVKDLLRLYYSVKAWDEMLVQYIKWLAELTLESSADTEAGNMTLCEFCAAMDMDVFETSHRLHHIDSQIYKISQGEIEVICQKLPIFQDKVLLRGPPVATFGRSEHLQQLISGKLIQRNTESPGSSHGGRSPYELIRLEGLEWWRHQRFGHGIATGIFTSSLLAYLVDRGLHPDPHVAEKLPLVMEALFSCHFSCKAFMNKFLPKLGGYVDTHGDEVALGCGLPLMSDIPRCAESILVFLRQWTDVSCHVVLREKSGATIKRSGTDRRVKGRVSVCSVSGRSITRGSTFNMDSFINELCGPKHDVHAVQSMLEGIGIPDDVFSMPSEERYRIDDAAERLWEHVTGQHKDLLETLEAHHRDLGPYMFIDLLSQENVTPSWGQTPQAGQVKVLEKSSTLINPLMAQAAKQGYKMDDDDEDDDEWGTEEINQFSGPMEHQVSERGFCLSDTFGIRLVDWPRDLVGSGMASSSTFVRYFSDSGRMVSRESLPGLPFLPWSFGSDERNSVILDIPGPGVAPFHCIFTQARTQPMRPCVVALGSSLNPAYIVCPKYQPIQIHNGDRLVCHQWNFELRIPSTGLHQSSLQILTDEGDVFDVPSDGCHVGAGNRSRRVPNQPQFPPTKFALKHRLKDMSAVHMAFTYHSPSNRWTLVDHSPEPFGTLLLLKTGTAHPLSHGSRIKLGPIIFETVLEVK